MGNSAYSRWDHPGNVKNLFLKLDEFIFELDLVHRTIVGLFCVLFHAAKLGHEDAIMRQQMFS